MEGVRGSIPLSSTRKARSVAISSGLGVSRRIFFDTFRDPKTTQVLRRTGRVRLTQAGSVARDDTPATVGDRYLAGARRPRRSVGRRTRRSPRGDSVGGASAGHPARVSRALTEPCVAGDGDCLCAVVDVEFGEDVGDVVPHGAFAEVEDLGDLLVGVAACDVRRISRSLAVSCGNSGEVLWWVA